MLDDFLVRAALAGVGVAVAAGLLGCFVVWRRMAYFGDATAHAAILGVALALLFDVSVFAGVGVVALGMALCIYGMSGRDEAVDTRLGVLAHSALALGLVAVTLVPGQRIDLDGYLFGDVLTVTRPDLAIIWSATAIVALVLWRHWSAMLTATLSADLAYAAGIDPRRQSLILTLLMAAVVAVAMKVVGALLITALLIIPAATARKYAQTPERMALLAVAIGALCAIAGLRIALVFDTPVGPTIICSAALTFLLSTIGEQLRRIGI
ncbi:metal ABC transporter permease [Yoonia sediminilitoris]|uniref:High-affinity zinc uptake system membrane protein ZnuB n=1 Tax=Yoonia sediminilitoris TaxID=1286148 RepID=A0A2T6KQD0_9RHOB|nr:metal ABC transporter permease [Yoonia sediminilitoris]PUB18764.1 zinc transport system permease protein [Yoonia sediminilitoris]RCW98932.1 zinc transport system permease protein [Yoonia sediminilitoris]